MSAARKWRRARTMGIARRAWRTSRGGGAFRRWKNPAAAGFRAGSRAPIRILPAWVFRRRHGGNFAGVDGGGRPPARDEGRPTLAICLGLQLLGERARKLRAPPVLGCAGPAWSDWRRNAGSPLGWNRLGAPGPGPRFCVIHRLFPNSYGLEAGPPAWTAAMGRHGSRLWRDWSAAESSPAVPPGSCRGSRRRAF